MAKRNDDIPILSSAVDVHLAGQKLKALILKSSSGETRFDRFKGIGGFVAATAKVHGDAHVHGTAIVFGNAIIDRGARIGPMVEVGEGSHIHENTVMHAHSSLGPDSDIDRDCTVYHSARLAAA